jgi:predicted DNA-binding protein with PD1-like motif
MGRIFVIRIDDGEDFLSSIQKFIVEKEIKSGMITFLGALKEGRMVTGPEVAEIPPKPMYKEFKGGWETVGIGTFYPGEGGAKIHIHTSLGRGDETLTGCLREWASVYLIVEAIIMEFAGLEARREYDLQTELYLPSLENKLL